MSVIKPKFKTFLSAIVCGCLLAPTILFAVSDLALGPAARLQKAGYTEFGVFMDQNKVVGEDTSNSAFGEGDIYRANFFLRMAFSSNFEYNLVVRDDQTTLHNFHLGVFSFNTHDDTYKHELSTGLRNVGWVTPTDEETDIKKYKTINIPVVSGYGMYSISSIEDGSNIHLGLASDRDNAGQTLVLAGIDYAMFFFHLLVEYDGKKPHFGVKIPRDNITFFATFAGRGGAEDEVSTQHNVFSFGASYKFNLMDEILNQFPTKAEFDDLSDTLNRRVSHVEEEQEKAKLLQQSDFLDDLEESLTKAIQDPKEADQDLSIKRAYKHMQDGLEFYYASQFDEAKKEYETVLKIIPTSTFAHMRLGSIYYQTRDYKKAKYHWGKAIELDPSNIALKEQMSSLLDVKEITQFEFKKDNPIPKREHIYDLFKEFKR